MHDPATPQSPGAIIGYRKNGAPIRLIGGGSEPAPEPPAEPAPPAGQDPAQATAGQGAPVPPQPPGEPPQPDPAAQEPAGAPAEPATVDDLPEWARKTVRDLRAENAAARQKAREHETALQALQAKSQEQLDGIARALGLKPEEATPEQIMAERDAEKARADDAARQARAAAVELAVFRAASAAGVNANALLDSRAFVTTLDGMDPGSHSRFRTRLLPLLRRTPAGNSRTPQPRRLQPRLRRRWHLLPRRRPRPLRCRRRGRSRVPTASPRRGRGSCPRTTRGRCRPRRS
jgi:hypothetical protein